MSEHSEIRGVLVANRGEVAVRIVRACRELGLRSIAVYSDVDANARHVRSADEAQPVASYLDAEALIGAAEAAGADAVHPGYGMLSEDAAFAAAVRAAGLVFVGPPAEVIARMGDKVAAREVAEQCGVAVPPGTGDLTDPTEAAAEAARIGYPLVVKASFGGGGRGMRVVDSPDGLAAAMAAAGREATAAFGRGDVHLERYVERPRHVEVQILADTHGTVVALGDRDCSVQRRHQKLIEEAPAFGLRDDVRAAITDAAVAIARHVGYVGAGTVEFLLEPASQDFFFLEMNTRLQVEHGVTELVTGIDIVATQLLVASGAPLPFREVRCTGHAIQARIAAEDPWENFRPAPGRITSLVLPDGPGVRTDFGVESGDVVAAEYDSMFGKVLALGADRAAARRRLGLALDELRVLGVPTTAPYLRTVLDTESFAAGTHDTGSIAREWTPDPATRPAVVPPVAAATSRRVVIATDRGPVEIVVHGRVRAESAGAARPVRERTASAAGSVTGGPAVAPMDATVVEVRVEAGQQVAAGDVVAVLEAMKMEIEINAGVAGTVAEVLVAAGAPVTAGTPLIILT